MGQTGEYVGEKALKLLGEDPKNSILFADYFVSHTEASKSERQKGLDLQVQVFGVDAHATYSCTSTWKMAQQL
jgi:hypothetical protein